MRRKGFAAILSVAALSLSAAPAVADPAFGPGHKGGGEGNSGPQVGKCHPPGQTADRPECK
jgi:hypothetical protein